MLSPRRRDLPSRRLSSRSAAAALHVLPAVATPALDGHCWHADTLSVAGAAVVAAADGEAAAAERCSAAEVRFTDAVVAARRGQREAA